MVMQRSIGAGLSAGPGSKQSTSAAEYVLTKFGLIIVWAVMAIIFGFLSPSEFVSVATLKTVFGSQEPLVFLALPLVLTFTVGEFDLSVAGTLGLAASVVTVLAVNDGVNVVVAAALAVAVGAVIGFVNAVLIVKVGVDAIITTLGMSTLLLGLSSEVTGGAPVSGLSARFADISNITFLGLPITFFYGVGLALLIAYILAVTPLGRHMSFVGLNREVSRLAGINVTRIRFGVYVTSGVVCAIGGVLLAASVGGFDPSTSTQYLLPAFAAVALGTVVILPGRFNPIGTLVAIYFLVTGIVGLQILGFTSWISDVFYGAALIVAVTLSHAVRIVANRGLRLKGP
jgi:ribose transport system permease protein